MEEYIVKLGWRCEFSFDDLDNAASFARVAFRTRTGDEVDDEVQIVIRKKTVHEEGEEIDD